jgi:hypothetical protein
MIAARHFELIREMKTNTYNHRLRLVESARQRGIWYQNFCLDQRDRYVEVRHAAITAVVHLWVPAIL